MLLTTKLITLKHQTTHDLGIYLYKSVPDQLDNVRGVQNLFQPEYPLSVIS